MQTTGVFHVGPRHRLRGGKNALEKLANHSQVSPWGLWGQTVEESGGATISSLLMEKRKTSFKVVTQPVETMEPLCVSSAHCFYIFSLSCKSQPWRPTLFKVSVHLNSFRLAIEDANYYFLCDILGQRNSFYFNGL